MRSVPKMAWAYVAVVAFMSAWSVALVDLGAALVMTAVGVLVAAGVVLGSRAAWLAAMMIHASAVLLIVLLAAWPWETWSWVLLASNLAAVATLLAPSLRLDRSLVERAPRGAC